MHGCMGGKPGTLVLEVLVQHFIFELGFLSQRVGDQEHLAGNGQRLLDGMNDMSPAGRTRDEGGRAEAGPAWVGDAAREQAASSGCSPELSAMSLGEAGPKWPGRRISALGQRERRS